MNQWKWRVATQAPPPPWTSPPGESPPSVGMSLRSSPVHGAPQGISLYRGECRIQSARARGGFSPGTPARALTHWAGGLVAGQLLRADSFCRCSSGDSTARLWRLTDTGSHDLPIVLPHEPVGRASQECNRDVTTVHWNVSEPHPLLGSQ